MINDPCWLPSAIMQTVGALYAVFIACFILSIQISNNFHYNGDSQEKTDPVFKIIFGDVYVMLNISVVIVIITELYNGLVLYYITLLDPTTISKLLHFSYITFIVSVTSVVVSSYYITTRIVLFNNGAFLLDYEEYHRAFVRFVKLIGVIFIIFLAISNYIYDSMIKPVAIIPYVIEIVLILIFIYVLFSILGFVRKRLKM